MLSSLRQYFLSLLPFKAVMYLTERLLAAQGFGGGGRIAKSGELGVISRLPGQSPVLFDVGAHTGEYAQQFLEFHSGGLIYCFEPSAEHFRLLRKRLEGRPNAHLMNFALGAVRSEGTLYTNAKVSGLASLTRRRLDHFKIDMDMSEPVHVDTLDNVLSNTGVDRIDLLKIDVEGHELDVLRGAVKAFQDRIIRRVQFEFGGSNLDTRTNLQDFFYFFDDIGFEISLVQPSGNLQPLRRYREMFEQYRTTNYVASMRK